MEKLVKKIELENFSIEKDLIVERYKGIDNSKMEKVLGYNVDNNYISNKNTLKEKIIKALTECDDFEIEYTECDRFGNECNLITYKIEVESDKDLKERKRKASISAKKSAEKRKKNKELKEKKEYERLSKKFA